jgi:mono/diheme cytochrome c family protein
MLATVRAALTLALVPAAGPALAAEPSDADLAIQARAILVKHCRACHGPDKPRGELPLLNHKEVTTGNWPVPIIKPGAPEESLMLHLVKDGSMPPADKPKLTADEIGVLEQWVRKQAPAYPERFDEAFALRVILADVERRVSRGTGVRDVRYVSLYHLLADDDNPVMPGPYRDALARALTALKARPDALTPVEPTATVLSLDLEAARLHQTLFKRVVGVNPDGSEEVSGAKDFNLFDLILLEYPLGRLPGDGELARALTDKFLVPANQIRPVTYVQGDWLAVVLTRSVLADDLRRLLGADLNPTLTDPPAMIASTPPGTPILPLDAVIPSEWRDYTPKPDPYQFALRVIDAGSLQPLVRAKPGDKVFLEGRTGTEQKVYLEVFLKPIKGDLAQMYAQKDQTGPMHVITLSAGLDKDGKMKPIDIDEEVGTEVLTAFVCDKPFPPGEILRGTGPGQTSPIERIVHPFYRLPPGPGTVDPAAVGKKTVPFEIRKP